MTPLKCLWCNRKCSPSRAGKPKKFCGLNCKRDFEAALRRYTLAALERGDITVCELRSEAAIEIGSAGQSSRSLRQRSKLAERRNDVSAETQE